MMTGENFNSISQFKKIYFCLKCDEFSYATMWEHLVKYNILSVSYNSFCFISDALQCWSW